MADPCCDGTCPCCLEHKLLAQEAEDQDCVMWDPALGVPVVPGGRPINGKWFL